MKVEVSIGDRGKAEIVVSVEQGSPWPVTIRERMLVPEARRARDALDRAIREAEGVNRPRPRRLGEY